MAPPSPDALILGPDRSGRTVVAEGGRVAVYGDSPELPDGAGRIECSYGAIEPGGVNAHTHIYSGLAPLGMPPPTPAPESFLQILERVWWRLDLALDRESLRASARYYVAEALLAGTTTLIDHHESPRFIEGSLDVLADACEELGMRAVLCYGATERNDGPAEAERGLAECERFIRHRRGELLRGLVGLHASFTVSDACVRRAGELCRELGAKLHVHVAEDGCDVDDARRRGYAGPLDRLFELEALPPGSLLAHGVHLEADDVRRAAEAGLWFLQNPRSNQGNRVGYPRALTESDRVAVGTDGYPSELDVEAEHLRHLAAEHGEPAAAVEARIAAGPTLAAELFGIDFVPFAAGSAADLVVRDHRKAREVVVAGRRVVADGRLMTADLDAIHAEARDQAPRLWERMAAI